MLVLSSILITIALIIIGFFLSKNTGKRFSQQGVEADAIILGIQLTGLYIKSDPQVIIQLQVKPDFQKNFITDIKETLNYSDFSSVQPGAKLRVKYNPSNRKQISVIKDVTNITSS